MKLSQYTSPKRTKLQMAIHSLNDMRFSLNNFNYHMEEATYLQSYLWQLQLKIHIRIILEMVNVSTLKVA